jgi:TolA-binding protein
MGRQPSVTLFRITVPCFGRRALGYFYNSFIKNNIQVNKLKILFALLFLAFLLICAGASAQQTEVYRDPARNYKQALELYKKEKFGSARRLFERALVENRDAHSEIRANSEFYAALCAAELFHKDAEDKILGFIRNYPENPKVNTARLYLANYHYKRKKYKDAAKAYEMVDIYELDKGQLPEYYFKKGYSYFETEKFNEASKMFFELKDVDTKYTNPANYYYAHIAYNQKNYETALTSFLRLQKDPAFGPIVPYYIAQIYFLQGRHDKVIEYAPALLDTANLKRAPEIARLLGESYFKSDKFEDAIPYLEKYQKAVGRLTREDAYQLGYAYLQVNNTDKSINLFEQVTRQEDTLAQSAYYQIGKAHLKKDNKNFARNAFRSASRMDFNPEIKEDALFTYAKLSYELANNPYNEAIEAFYTYIKSYPKTPRADEAYKYLLNVFITTKNYKEALTVIESIGKKDKSLEYAYQKVAYYRGVDLFNTYQYSDAITHFDKAIAHPLDKNVTAQSYYWKGEAQFNLKKYDDAIATYRTFLFEPGAAAQQEYFAANYNIGYAYFKKRSYAEAISWFRKYAGITPSEDNKKLNDALLRIADCYFITQDYGNAADYYGQAAKIQILHTDYALYQRGLCLGLVGKKNEKINALEGVIKNYPNSFYAIDSKLEIGRTYLELGDNENAMAYFKRIETEHPGSAVVGKAIVMQGLIHANLEQDDQAVAMYKRVLKEYPGTPQANEALTGIKSISIVSGRPELYSDVIENTPYVNVSKASLDSTHYISAEGLYLKGDFEGALNSFNSYLQKYPEGIFKLHANFYKSECYFRANNFDQALAGYQMVIERPKNIFTEKSLAKAAEIHFKKNDFQESRKLYERLEKQSEIPQFLLEARIGLMRSNYKLDNLDAAKTYADRVLTMDNLMQPVQNEATLIQAKQMMKSNNLEDAFAKFKTTVEKARATEIGAEAKYNMAYIRYAQQKFKDSEKEIFELGDKFSAFEYWVAKGFILLADNYIAMDDTFQAKHTLQSIIDNYEGDDLKRVAQEKLNRILETEKPSPQRKAPEPIDIEIGSGSGTGPQMEGGDGNE